jgi:hypothetical protein
MHMADLREEFFTGINITVRKSLCENSWIRLMTGDFDLFAELHIIIAHIPLRDWNRLQPAELHYS